MIDEAEAWLRGRGLRLLRVRYHKGDLARVEVPLEELPGWPAPRSATSWSGPSAPWASSSSRSTSKGFRSGSLNALIPLEGLRLSASSSRA